MSLSDKRCFLFGIAVAMTATVIDQLHKWFMLEMTTVPLNPVEVLPFFNLVMVWNRGISFGMFASDNDANRWFLVFMALFLLFLLLIWLWKTHHVWAATAIGLVIGGASGNIIDRVRFGAVADFFDVHAFGYHWPAFNLADSFIFIGVVMLLIEGFIIKEEEKKQP